MTPRWHFGPPAIPPRAALLSALVLVVPVAAALSSTELGRYEALLWLTALVPGFLLAYYRGWSGIATGSMNLSARLAGDEFVSIVSSGTVDCALVFVRRVQEQAKQVADLPGRISVSAGIAEYDSDIPDEEEFLKAADEALYEAKTGPYHYAIKRHHGHVGSS